MTKITTNELRLQIGRSPFRQGLVYESVPSVWSSMYAFIGNHVDPSATRPLFDAPYWTSIDPYRNMIAGKKVGTGDVSLMIRDVQWVSGTVYAMYDDSDPELFSKDFFVSVTDGTYRHAFKCLDNDNGSPSTAAPDFGDVSPDDEVYQTADGYRWKYMFTVDDSIRNKFSFDGFLPVVSNAEVVEAATTGAIDIVRVLDGGTGYSNHLKGTFGAADVRVGGNNFVFSLAGNSSASAANGFYTGCMVYLSSGTGSGQSRRIVDYFSNSAGRFITLDVEFGPHPTNGTGWEISPEVVITGSGTETVEASARALVNSVGNSIYRVEVLSRGAGYTVATAAVTANSIVPVVGESSVRVIYQPPGGHGSDAASELGCTHVGVSVTFNGSESNTIPIGGSFGQLGLMRDPIFADCVVNLSESNGSFFVGERLFSFTKKLVIDGGASTTVSSNVITCDGARFDERLEANDVIFAVDTINDKRFMSSIASVTNSSQIVVTDEVQWACTDVKIYAASKSETAIVTGNPFSNVVYMTSLTGEIRPGDEIMVTPGGGWGVIDTVERGGMIKGFDTFVGLTRLVGSLTSGSFEEGELVYQGESSSEATSSGYLHSTEVDGSTVTLFLSRVTGEFSEGAARGATSTAELEISDILGPEVEPGSGRVLYLQNIQSVERGGDQTESVNVLLNFG